MYQLWSILKLRMIKSKTRCILSFLVLIVYTVSCEAISDSADYDQYFFRSYNFLTQASEPLCTYHYTQGNHCSVWISKKVDFNGINPADIASIVMDYFDNTVYPKLNELFGQLPDLDSNGRVNIVIYDIKDTFSSINRSYVGGYFNPYDSYTDELIQTAISEYRSNEGEYIYLDVYPLFVYGGLENFLSVIAHEMYHMMSFHSKILSDPTATPTSEDLWVEEGLAELANDLVNQNVLYNRLYSLQDASGRSLIWYEYDGEKATQDYGTAYSFMRYCYEIVDDYSGNFIQQLMENKETGIPNMQSVFSSYGTDIETVFRNYLFALINRGDEELDFHDIDWSAVIDLNGGEDFHFTQNDFQSASLPFGFYIYNVEPGTKIDFISETDNSYILIVDEGYPACYPYCEINESGEGWDHEFIRQGGFAVFNDRTYDLDEEIYLGTLIIEGQDSASLSDDTLTERNVPAAISGTKKLWDDLVLDFKELYE